MATPICVFDAQTFVDHIHQIKAWLYGGHLRLVVPISTSENVEQLYKKSVEPKSTAQETPRPKLAGKPAKKVHPAFDINPTVAREFLIRVQNGKAGEQYVKERPPYEEDEKWDAVHFQTSEEEYTPWKTSLGEELDVEAPDDRPLSWAELAKKKSQANGSADTSQLPKGPAKPKLVSKASGPDMQPWKMQANAPKISVKEVPSHHRSLMRCALWRLHESIDRNDSNQLFLVSDQEEVRLVAKKLNITVRSARELGKRITASVKKDDLNVVGMLEKENLVRPQGKSTTLVPSITDSGNSSKEQVFTPPVGGGLLHCMDVLGRSDGADAVGGSDRPENGVQQMHTDEKEPGSENHLSSSSEEILPHCSSDHPVKPTLDPRDLVQGLLKPPLAQARHGTDTDQVQGATNTSNGLQPAAEIREASSEQTSKEVLTPVTPVVASNASGAKPAAPIAQENQEDSDEEVVVFVPNSKRMSAHRRGLASSPRPATAHGEPSASPMQCSPKKIFSDAQGVLQAAEHGAPSVQGAQHGYPRPLSSHTVMKSTEQGPSNAKVVPHGRPRPLSSGPTIIDPEAFGRGLPVNTGAGTRSNIGSSKKPRQHSPRTSMQNSSHTASGSLNQDPPRTSPSRHKAGRSPRRSPRVLPQKAEDPPATSIPVISHQAYTRAPLVAPVPQATAKARFGAIGPPSESAVNLQASAPSLQSDAIRDLAPRRPAIQRPRSAHGPGSGNASIQPHRQAPPPEALNGSPPSGRAGNREQRSSRPSLFQPELDRTAAPTDASSEPRRTKMPDVQYTLKSGTTREAARGKGKLWVG